MLSPIYILYLKNPHEHGHFDGEADHRARGVEQLAAVEIVGKLVDAQPAVDGECGAAGAVEDVEVVEQNARDQLLGCADVLRELFLKDG